MKKFHFSFSNEERSAISAAVSVLPEYSIYEQEPQIEQLLPVGLSVLNKLANSQNVSLSFFECCFVADSIAAALDAISGKFDISDDGLNQVKGFFFTYKKLMPVFERFL